MSGATPLLPQYAFMAWCPVKKKAQGQLYLRGKIFSSEFIAILNDISASVQF
jgi:hypothetical protein